MKLLFDQNLPPRLPHSLSVEFPDSAHVRDEGLARASDEEIWRYAAENEFTVVSKDTDFMQMSFVFGAPPKVICIRRGNCSTVEIEAILRENVETIGEFIASTDLTYLLLH